MLPARAHSSASSRRSGAYAGALLALVVVLVALGGCGLTSQPGSQGGGPVTVVAVENFWGSIVAQIGGARVRVTVLIRDLNADPHTYEPTAADARTVAEARYVIVNGAGYDAWAERLLTANPVAGRVTLNIGDLAKTPVGGNPHLWYSPDVVSQVATRIRDDLKALDSAHAAEIDASAQAFLTGGLKDYHDQIASIKAKYAGTPVGATESIFAYMATALGLNLITPPSYLKAVSEGEDISAADEATVERQIARKEIKILVYNSQNTPNNIAVLIAKARASGIPVAIITETLTPATASFQDWQAGELRGIAAALAQATGA